MREEKISRIKNNMLGFEYYIYHNLEQRKEYVEFLLSQNIWFEIEFFKADAVEVKDKKLDTMYKNGKELK